VFWFWLGLVVLASAPVLLAIVLVLLYFYLCKKYLHFVVRIFHEKPLFIIPRGQPIEDAEEVRFTTDDGLELIGCYLKTGEPRKGVILFGLEFGSNRWSCVQYCDHLRAAGFDIFTFESRSQGDSQAQAGYEPLQWLTDLEVRDVQAAVKYLKSRPDTDPRGIGFFGISKGGGAGLLAAARDPYFRCFVTDGIFGTHSTMVPYMRKWITIYSDHHFLQWALPLWYYGIVGHTALRRIGREWGCRFPSLERALRKLASRPLLMIHGGNDTYIKPEMAQRLFAMARAPKELWLVEGAKHNQALQVAGDEYRQRVLDFFLTHLAERPLPIAPSPLPLVPEAGPRGQGEGTNGRLPVAAPSGPHRQSPIGNRQSAI
jgi:pimeloyl-ACP methyl ester carboxylesterase